MRPLLPFLPQLQRLRSRVARAYLSARVAQTQPYTPIRVLREGADPARDAGKSAFDSRRAFAWLELQCATGPRIPGSEGHRQTRELILRELGGRAHTVAFQYWEQRVLRGAGAGQRLPMTNIFGIIRGTDDLGLAPEAIRPDLMLCTHWDTRPTADHDPDPSRRSLPVPGASDGASGVAVLLEVARVLQASPPRRSVILAFWDGEDLGDYYYGSRLFARYVRRASMDRWRPARAVLVDMVGGTHLRCTEETNSIAWAPELWAEVHAAARALGLEDHFHGPARRINDDHTMLNRAGIPAIVLIDYSYPFWHTTGDTLDHCSPESLGVVGQVLLRLVAGERAGSGPVPIPLPATHSRSPV